MPQVIKANFILNSFESFWRQHPALLYGLAILIGFSFSLNGSPVLFLPALLLLLAGKRTILAYALLIVSLFFVNSQISMPTLSEEGIKGSAHFEISSIALKSTHFGKQWVYKGIIQSLLPHPAIKNIPVSISIPVKKEITRPQADKGYWIEGTLKAVSDNHYIFILEKNGPWQEVKNSWSLAEMRYLFKKNVSSTIHQKIEDEQSATFLAGIATGEFDDRLMAFHFSRFGLQHIMAISGFHFAIISGILRFILQLVFSKRAATFALITFITGYFLFLGF